MTVLSRSVAERFWSKVKIGTADECWEWLAQKNRYGYGHFALESRKPVRAHRLAYRLARGDIGDSLLVCHRCDNRACVNPAHLFLGTAADNTADMCRKGRARGSGIKGSDHANSKLTEQDIVAIRSMDGTLEEIAAKFGVYMTTISKIKRRQTWRHVP